MCCFGVLGVRSLLGQDSCMGGKGLKLIQVMVCVGGGHTAGAALGSLHGGWEGHTAGAAWAHCMTGWGEAH